MYLHEMNLVDIFIDRSWCDIQFLHGSVVLGNERGWSLFEWTAHTCVLLQW